MDCGKSLAVFQYDQVIQVSHLVKSLIINLLLRHLLNTILSDIEYSFDF